MRKRISILPVFFFLVCTQLYAQDPTLGISGAGTGFFPKYSPEFLSSHPGVNPHFIPGVTLECNYIIRGYSFPVSAFNGIGITIYQPVHDSVVLDGWNHNFWPTTFTGTSKRSYRNFMLHFGYEIPQQWNDFLFLHIGWGMGCNFQKVTYDLVGFNSSDCSLVNPDIKIATMTEKHGAFAGEVMFGGMYEFEKFYILIQYALRMSMGGDISVDYRFQHSFSAGVFFPLKRF